MSVDSYSFQPVLLYIDVLFGVNMNYRVLYSVFSVLFWLQTL